MDVKYVMVWLGLNLRGLKCQTTVWLLRARLPQQVTSQKDYENTEMESLRHDACFHFCVKTFYFN
jgi:hypothetical protein